MTLAEQQQSQTGTPSSTSIHTGNTLTEEAQPTPPYATPQHSAHSEADSKASNAAPRNISQAEINRERELMRLLMTKGETIVCITENEDQQDIKLTAFEFVSNGLQEDNIQLYFPLYNRILDEGLKHLHDEGFTAERFFAHHPDTQISTLSFELTEDKEPLSKIHSDAPEEQRYDDNVIMLVNSIKLYHAKMEAASLCEKLKRINPKDNPEEYRQLFQNYVLKDSQVKRLAKECGNKVVIN